MIINHKTKRCDIVNGKIPLFKLKALKVGNNSKPIRASQITLRVHQGHLSHCITFSSFSKLTVRPLIWHDSSLSAIVAYSHTARINKRLLILKMRSRLSASGN